MKANNELLFKLVLGFSVAFAAFSLAAAPLQNLRCGSRLVSIGANTTQLIEYCGQPTSVEQQTNRVPVEHYDESRGETITTYEDRPYEVWVYNFGPSRLVTRLTVVGNEVRQMETAGYGW